MTALGQTRDAMRLVILEDVPSADVDAAEKRNRGKLAFSNGALLGKSFIKFKSGAGGAKVGPIPNSPLDQWFVDEELARPTNNGHVFFIHSKVLIIDPLSDDPLVCSGSANFSKNSLTANDENMLLIRGNTRVADIYMTELDRIFRHFRARDIINQQAAAGSKNDPLLLDPTDNWIAPNFTAGTYKDNRRQLFFPDAGKCVTVLERRRRQGSGPLQGRGCARHANPCRQEREGEGTEGVGRQGNEGYRDRRQGDARGKEASERERQSADHGQETRGCQSRERPQGRREGDGREGACQEAGGQEIGREEISREEITGEEISDEDTGASQGVRRTESS